MAKGASRPQKSSRVVAAQVLRRVLHDGAYAQLALHAALSRGAPLPPQDRGLVTELVYGTLRYLPLLDSALAQACRRPLKKVDEAVLDVMRVGAYETLHLQDRDHAAVNEAVNAARLMRGDGAGGFANGVLRGLLRLRDNGSLLPSADPTLDGVVARTGLPRWLAQDVTAQLGLDGAEAFGRHSLTRGEVHVCAPGEDEGARARVADALRGHKLDSEPHAWVNTALVLKGGMVDEIPRKAGARAWVQNAASQFVAGWAAQVAPRDAWVMDLCSAPGGKSSLMAARGLRVISADLHVDKLHLARRQWATLDVFPRPVAMDGRRPALGQGSVGLVLLDAPCTGTGLLSRRPEIKLRKDEADVNRLVALQQELLDSAAVLCGQGGYVLYSVCSVTRAEGRRQVEAFLRRHEGFALAPPPAGLPLDAVRDGMVTLWPHLHGTDGFFAALMQRNR